MAGLSLAWSLFQALAAALVPDDLLAQLMQMADVPPSLAWALEHRLAISLALLVLSGLFPASSWGLLRRREWGRISFIAFLVAGAALNFLALAAIEPFFDGIHSLLPAASWDSEDGRQLLAELQMTRALTWASGLLGAAAFAALHGAIVWKLLATPIRQEFGAQQP